MSYLKIEFFSINKVYTVPSNICTLLLNVLKSPENFRNVYVIVKT